MGIRYKCFYHSIYKKDNGELDIRTRDICIGALARGYKNLEDCKTKCRSKGICIPIILIENILMEFKEQKFTWNDMVEIDGKHYEEEFPISGLMDDENTYQIDEFINAVALKHNVYPENIKTYIMDGFKLCGKDFGFIDSDDIDYAPHRAEYGCYINGTPEECYD